jgi:SAM-dependent methyltransferase
MNTVLQASPPTAFDADKFKTTTRAQWQSAAGAWHRWGPFIGSWLGDATEAMFELAGVGPGCRVLDVAAGAGEQSLAAARRVGAGGHVLATDIAPALLDHANAMPGPPGSAASSPRARSTARRSRACPRLRSTSPSAASD